MKTNIYADKSYAELTTEVKELKSELFKLRFQAATSSLENPMKLKEVKKNIARAKTQMRKLELAGDVE